MKIAICGSIDFTPEIKKAADQLLAKGHKVDLPTYSKKILEGELTLEEFKKKKEKSGDWSFRVKVDEDLIKRYFQIIKESDAVLIVNIDKKGIKNYIGGNTLLEMGFAYVLDRKIFLLNNIPKIHYTDEIKAMQPIILNRDLSRIK